MVKVLEEAIASSSAHGISRAATTKAKPLRVMWILLFIIFLAIFLKSGISLVLKLNENKLTKIYHLDQAPFVFPDLYFCPSNPYSGSYPFSLTKEEADLLNNEVSRLIAQFGKMFDYPKGTQYMANMWASQVQRSLSFHLLARYMLVRKEQSVLSAMLKVDYNEYSIRIKTFYNCENLICFQVILEDFLKQSMMNPKNSIEIRLSTDPHLTDLNFSGYPIQPITDDYNNSIPFLEWHPTQSLEILKVSGFRMLTVPPGAYPSLRFENTFHMAPGNAYMVKLKMTENACSGELHKTHCIASHPQVGFTNPMTEERELFSYSSAACNYLKLTSGFVEKIGCQNSQQPSLWEYRDHPHCLNISELTKVVLEKMKSVSNEDFHNFELDAKNYCKTRIPCSYPKYSASYSFGKWPSIGSSTVKYLATFFDNIFVRVSEADAPALARVSKIAKALQSGNHSAHLEGIFRSYVSESMLSVRISIDSVTSPQVVLTWAYTLTDFLADTGGLLGLYIGCSVLTLCELLELIYICVSLLLKKRLETRSAAGGAMEAGVGDADENVAL